MAQRQDWNAGKLFRVRSDRSLLEGVPLKHVESFKLLRAGTVEKLDREFVPAFPKRQHEARGANHPTHRNGPRKLSEEERHSEIIGEHEQVSLFHPLSPASVDKCKSMTNVQLETKTQNECVGVSHVVDDGPYGTVTDAFVGGTCVETLLDTGATTNLIRSEVAWSLEDKPEIRPFEGQLQTADGRGMDVEGCITTNMKLGEIDDDIEALVVPELRKLMALKLRSMEEYKCCLNFGCDKLWTGLTEESEVPVSYAIPARSVRADRAEQYRGFTDR